MLLTKLYQGSYEKMLEFIAKSCHDQSSSPRPGEAHALLPGLFEKFLSVGDDCSWAEHALGLGAVRLLGEVTIRCW